VTASIDIKEDIRQGCESIGPVTSVTLYDLEPEGIVSVKFKLQEDALRCLREMSGRFFGGRQLETSLHDDITRYKKTKGTSAEEEEERLEKFGNWLEEENES
jgi:HIV Tat-specific factor 1